MSTLVELQTQLSDINTDVEELLAAIVVLQEQVAKAPVTQEQLDALVVQAQSINDKS